MEEVKAKGKRKVSTPRKRKRFDGEGRLRLVKLHVEEGIPRETVCREAGICKGSLDRWVQRYQREGAAGLASRKPGGSRKGLPSAVKERIVSLKRSHPESGVRRISHLLRRMFFLPGSPESVRKTLKDAGLNSPPRKPRRHNITRPRFFERATPNQMWQTDIFTFRLGGRYAYLIGFIDDYSRYMVGLGLYLSQTAQNVIEVYRKSTAEYGVPKEMLTDNGRQYTSWHGTSKFEGELKKDRVHHIKSQPHHPMTLGKIERFWKTIFEEFLGRAQFESFENAQERVRIWVKYYNHRRPHQGIGGLCPADRYFEIQSEVRKTIESGIQENLLEMALRGKPKDPFYLIGRMEGQSVVLRAEKGKLKLTVDSAGSEEQQEAEYDLTSGGDNGEADKEGHETGAVETHVSASVENTLCTGKDRGGTDGVVGAPEPFAGVPGNGDNVDYIESVAGTSDGGDAPSAGTAGDAFERPSIESPAAGDAGAQAGGVLGLQACEAVRGSAENHDRASGRAGANGRITDDVGTGETAGGSDHAGAQRSNQRERGSTPDGCLTQDVLRVGTEGTHCPFGSPGGRCCRPSGSFAGGPGTGDAAHPCSVTGTRTADGETERGGAESAGALRATAAVAAG